MFQRQEYADIARAGIERSGEGHEQERPELRQSGEREPRRGHQQGCGEQQPALRKPMPPCAHRQRGQRRSEQGGGGHQAHFPPARAESEQMGGQEDGDIAVAERAQRPAREKQPGLECGLRAHPGLRMRNAFPAGVPPHQA
ncbi:MAG: hypothetical protein OHK0026_00560 [Rhodocyclaceae bacterium]